MTQSALDNLRTQLAKAANTPVPDIGLIQKITGDIARLDPDNVRFTVDAGLISRLGQELVGKQETAVAELIKNAYDADATEVKIVFENSDAPGGTLLIEDNGLGMTREQLLNGFMRLSSNEKLLNPISTRFMRRRAGRKGIGRFAVQRLGKILVLTTQVENTDTALRVRVNWDDFQSGYELNSIANKIEIVPKQRLNGTTLFIEHLRDAWSNAEQRRVYRYISDILQPFPLTKFKRAVDVSPTASKENGFQVTLLQQTDKKEEIVASQEETIFSNALAVIEGYVDQKGQGLWSIESKNLGLEEEIASIGKERDGDTAFSYLRNVSIKAYYYIWLKELFPSLLYSSLFEIGRNGSGIKVFRNGFRVAPYGEKGDDWLGLDFSSGARKILPPHANSNFIGFVELDDPLGQRFEELASREGLIENPAFRELQDFASRVLIAGVRRIAEVREKKQTPGQASKAKETPEDPAEQLRDVASKIRKATKKARQRKTSDSSQQAPDGGEDDNSESEEQNFDEFDAAAKVLEDLADNTQKLLQENQLLRVLASLGLVIAEFTHEIKHVVGAAQHSINVLGDIVVSDENEKQAISWLKDSVGRLQGYSAFFDQTVSDTVRRELEPQDLRAVGWQFEEAMAASIKRAGIMFDFIPAGYELFTPPMHASEINSLLFNFYSNSFKAIRRARVDGKMQLKVGEENQVVYLEFSDNGDGVPEENRERIFNAFFTTSTPGSRSNTVAEETQGSGLGLKIVADIVHSYGGEVYLAKAPEGYTTSIRAEFPAHTLE